MGPEKNFVADVLVLGAGLAGLRAALSASQNIPGLQVAVACPSPLPSGSSFANANRRLGMQLCQGPDEQAAFIREALAIARPGFIREELVRLLALESAERFVELRRLGVPFEVDGDGRLAKYSACFSPASRRAVILNDLPATHAALTRALKQRGVELLQPWLAVEIVIDQEKAVGAVLADSKNPERFIGVRAGAVVCALGGPAPLFARNQAGPGNSGYSYGLLARAGARLENAGFMQLMWAETVSRRFFPIQCLADPGAGLAASGGVVPLPADIVSLAPARAGHCPMGHFLADAALDRYLLARADQDGGVAVFHPDLGERRIALMAHAGNGGAVIDPNGGVEGVGGLFAAGECATGMHGANRLGGAMVAATQVFGHRAGSAAARTARENGPPHPELFTGLMKDHLGRLGTNLQELADTRRKTGEELHSLFSINPLNILEILVEEWTRKRGLVRDWQAALCLDTAILMGQHRMRSETEFGGND